MKVVALAGGVGGAKLVDGLAKIIPGDDLTVIVNTGDDFDHFGLRICPDLDTICYTLAGIANPITGWGRAGESWNVLESIQNLGGPTWFQLGDRDLGIHLERTRLLSEGESMSEICNRFCILWNITPKIIPMSNDRIATLVYTNEGELPFQDYFVKRKCEPEVSGFEFRGAEIAVPAPGVLEALNEAGLIIICPSNPWVSVDPILAVPGIRDAILKNSPPAAVIAVSPIIQGNTIKGPAAKMFSEMGITPSAASVAEHYGSSAREGLLSGFVFDVLDICEEATLAELEISTLLTNTIMKNDQDRISLADGVIRFARSIIK